MDAVEREPNERAKAIHDSIAVRLRPVCSHFPEDLFEQLVAEITRLTLKYEPSAPTVTLLPEGERLIEDLKSTLQRSLDARADNPDRGKA